jgi:hypothetical protein
MYDTSQYAQLPAQLVASQTVAIENSNEERNAGVVFVLLVLPLRPFAREDYPPPGCIPTRPRMAPASPPA